MTGAEPSPVSERSRGCSATPDVKRTARAIFTSSEGIPELRHGGLSQDAKAAVRSYSSYAQKQDAPLEEFIFWIAKKPKVCPKSVRNILPFLVRHLLTGSAGSELHSRCKQQGCDVPERCAKATQKRCYLQIMRDRTAHSCSRSQKNHKNLIWCRIHRTTWLRSCLAYVG